MHNILSVRDLRLEAVTYPPNEASKTIAIVDGVSFELKKGKVLGLIGESGAGKSSIGLSALAYGRGGVSIAGGEIRLEGKDLATAARGELQSVRGAKICYVAQSAAASFNPAHRLGDQVIEATVRHKLMSAREAKTRAVNLFRTLGLPDPENFGNRYPHQVSGGQLQRAMTAMALCSNPSLIVFDEPTTALDVTTQIEVLAAIKHAIQTTHTAALYITHDLAVVAQIADDIMVLRHGKTVEYGSTEQIITKPAQAYTQALVNVQQTQKLEAHDQSGKFLAVTGISAQYSNGFKVLKDISLHLPKGQTLAVVGESGSGKSTLARVITGLLPPSSGSIQFAGETLPSSYRARTKKDLRRVQLVYQMADTAMNPRQTVRDIIGRPLTFYEGIRGAKKTARVAELLERIEMGKGFIDRYPAELSGGQKQRVAIARALASSPELIICDEPTSALDPLVAKEILKLLLKLQAEEHLSYLFITHDIGIVRSIADSVAIMHQGSLVDFGPKSQVLSPPFADYTAHLLRSVPEMRTGWLEDILSENR